MKHIKTITDKEILGDNTLSKAKPRRTARAVLENQKGEIALLYSREYNIYSLPGGGIEEGEDIKDALYRELGEETGCNITGIAELGYIEENRGYSDYTQISYYFKVTTDSSEFHPRLTATEEKYGTSIGWYSLKDAYEKITSQKYGNGKHLLVNQRNQIKFLRARDIAAFEEYLKGVKTP